jgi:hypothetical protein
MSANNNLSTLNGLFKEVYADKLENLIPDGVKLLKAIKFVAKDKQNGSLYHQPVVLGLEHGVTFSSGGDAFTLNAAIAGQIKDAQVQGTQLVLRSILSYTAAARSVGGGVRAFEDATKFLVGNMLRSMARKLEAEILYGQMGYGVIDTGGVSGNVMTIKASEWAPGLWVGAENMPLDLYTAGDTLRGSCVVVSVDMDARTVTVDSMPGGAAATDVVYHGGAHGNEFAGIHKILTNTGSLFNISAATYTLWKGNQYDAAGALSFTKINSAIARAVEKGLDSNVVCFVNPRTWANLLSDQAALRRFDSSYKSSEMENGAESIRFFAQCGLVEINPSIFVKEGYAYILPMDELARIGSTDITFKRPGQGEEFFRDLESAAGYELRAFCDQAVFSSAPGKMVLIKGIVNS